MKIYDVLIIGSGSAGMNAAVYTARMDLKTAIIEKGAPGGKLVNISKIENWIGDKIVGGPELAIRMDAHVKSLGVESIFGNVSELNESSNFVKLDSGEIIGYKFLIIATGTSEVIPTNVLGIHKFNNKGVSYCAICDGPLYKGGKVAVMGGGNSAIEEATYLSTVAKEVRVFVRSKITAEKKLVDDISKRKNVFIHLNEEITEISGDEKLSSLSTNLSKYEIDALFPYIGLKPNTDFLTNANIDCTNSFINVDENMKTSVDNIYSIGDVNNKHIRQISTAVSDGTIAAKSIAQRI